MIRNYFNVIVQNIFRNKTYSLINILGLSVGLAVCMIILQYVRFEQSYDRFHSRADNLYRIILEFTTSSGITQRDAANYAPTAEALINDYPEVKAFARITPEYSKVVFSHEDKIFEEPKVYYADSTLFTLFDFKLLHGDAKTALAEVGSVVLSRSAAEKYFGPVSTWKESPLNQPVLMNNKEILKVTGIMEDIPVNSHIQANALISFTTFIKRNDPSKEWGWNDFYTYFELAPGTDYKQFESKLPEMVKKYKGKDTKDRMIVQPLKDIYLKSDAGFELNANGNAQTIYFLSVISIVILIIAWVNYINLSTARAGHRAKEIGVRKVNGATRGEVMIQFLLESFCMNFIALIFAFGTVSAIMPLVSQMLEKPLHFSLLNDNEFVVYAGIIYVVGSLASGLYPAVILSSFKPVKIFKTSSFAVSKGKPGLRQGLVIFQFMTSAALITGTLIIESQMNFIRTKDLGYSFDKTVVLSASSTQKNDSLFFLSCQHLKQTLLKYPEIGMVSVSSVLPGKSHNDLDTHGSLRMVGDSEDISYSLTTFRVDEDFIPLFNMKLIAGGNFSGKHNQNEMVLNRKAAELFGFNDPQDIVGKKISYWGKEKEVIGVIENYHHKSLKNTFEPIIIRNWGSSMLYVTIRFNDNGKLNLEKAIANLNKQWTAIYPNDPFVYFFLEDHVSDQYKADTQFSSLFSIFSGFSIFIACLGLFGLVSYSVTVRTKEIGVRKVLGASITSIVVLFTRSYFKLLVIAFVIGIPLAYYILRIWMNNFAYKTSIGWVTFIIPVCAISLLALLVISVQIIKAALSNPVNSLRQE
jgi:putative ABC transport system permease protein